MKEDSFKPPKGGSIQFESHNKKPGHSSQISGNQMQINQKQQRIQKQSQSTSSLISSGANVLLFEDSVLNSAKIAKKRKIEESLANSFAPPSIMLSTSFGRNNSNKEIEDPIADNSSVSIFPQSFLSYSSSQPPLSATFPTNSDNLIFSKHSDKKQSQKISKQPKLSKKYLDQNDKTMATFDENVTEGGSNQQGQILSPTMLSTLQAPFSLLSNKRFLETIDDRNLNLDPNFNYSSSIDTNDYESTFEFRQEQLRFKEEELIRSQLNALTSFESLCLMNSNISNSNNNKNNQELSSNMIHKKSNKPTNFSKSYIDQLGEKIYLKNTQTASLATKKLTTVNTTDISINNNNNNNNNTSSTIIEDQSPSSMPNTIEQSTLKLKKQMKIEQISQSLAKKPKQMEMTATSTINQDSFNISLSPPNVSSMKSLNLINEDASTGINSKKMNNINSAPSTMKIIGKAMEVTTDAPQEWICPTCNKPENSNPMICCDSCDDWYHW
jgi:hypothetical protein